MELICEKKFLCKMKMFCLLIFLDLALIFHSGDVEMKIKFFLCDNSSNI